MYRVVLATIDSRPTGQIRDTAYSTLDQLITNDEQCQNVHNIFVRVVNGIRECNGKGLYSVLKTVCTLYEKHYETIQDDITRGVVK